MARVLVIGASQGVGREAVKALLADGHHVTAFSRNASRLAINHPQLEKRDGDALDATTVTAALHGQDVVIQSLGVSVGLDAMLKGTTLFSRATRILVDAMMANGPRRLVAVTGIGAGETRGQLGFVYDALMFPLVLKRVYDDKDVQEQIIKRSSLDWTIARPGILTDRVATGSYRALTKPEEWRAAPIARADVARFLADEVREGRFIGRAPVVIS
ncbi:MAG: SDR family oxidoreductase [Hyphomicrobiaceae bacterium]|nr:SDR family oxidoreductase [Hyphomicrobiaceae bacterium]